MLFVMYDTEKPLIVTKNRIKSANDSKLTYLYGFMVVFGLF